MSGSYKQSAPIWSRRFSAHEATEESLNKPGKMIEDFCSQNNAEKSNYVHRKLAEDNPSEDGLAAEMTSKNEIMKDYQKRKYYTGKLRKAWFSSIISRV